MSNELPQATIRCSDCRTAFRITLKKGRVPSRPIPCPKCNAPIKVTEAHIDTPGARSGEREFAEHLNKTVVADARETKPGVVKNEGADASAAIGRIKAKRVPASSKDIKFGSADAAARAGESGRDSKPTPARSAAIPREEKRTPTRNPEIRRQEQRTPTKEDDRQRKPTPLRQDVQDPSLNISMQQPFAPQPDVEPVDAGDIESDAEVVAAADSGAPLEFDSVVDEAVAEAEEPVAEAEEPVAEAEEPVAEAEEEFPFEDELEPPPPEKERPKFSVDLTSLSSAQDEAEEADDEPQKPKLNLNKARRAMDKLKELEADSESAERDVGSELSSPDELFDDIEIPDLDEASELEPGAEVEAAEPEVPAAEIDTSESDEEVALEWDSEIDMDDFIFEELEDVEDIEILLPGEIDDADFTDIDRELANAGVSGEAVVGSEAVDDEAPDADDAGAEAEDAVEADEEPNADAVEEDESPAAESPQKGPWLVVALAVLLVLALVAVLATFT